jgi:hypothetical protein
MEACYGGTDVMKRPCAVARGIDINSGWLMAHPPIRLRPSWLQAVVYVAPFPPGFFQLRINNRFGSEVVTHF